MPGKLVINGDEKNSFVKNNKSLSNDELQLYVKYKLTVINQSELNSGYITGITDYYDSDLYYHNEVHKYYDNTKNYIKQENNPNTAYGYADITLNKIFQPDSTKNPKTDENMGLISSWAEKIDVTGKKQNLGKVWWTDTKNKEMNTDINLKEMSTSSLGGTLLAPNEKIDIYIIFKVQKTKEHDKYGDYRINIDSEGEETDNSKGKANIAEITSYKPLNYDGTAGGRIDIDSAPGNIELKKLVKEEKEQIGKFSKNGKFGNRTTYEDDTDVAPLLKVILDENQNKRIDGYVWEDITQGDPTKLKEGNGKRDLDENYVKDVQVELVRKEYDKASGMFKETPFTKTYLDEYLYKNVVSSYAELYPEEYKNCQVMTDTGGGKKGLQPKDKERGEYNFGNLIESGEYYIRFHYGTEKHIKNQLSEMSKLDTTIYNGHDFKTTKFDVAKNKTDKDVLLKNTNINHATDYIQKEEDLPTYNGGKVVPPVTGRLEVMQYSQKMTAEQSDVLNMEYIKRINSTINKEEWLTKIKGFADKTKMTAYSIPFAIGFNDKNNEPIYTINMGLQERPLTKLEVKNRIERITVTLSNNQKIIDFIIKDNGDMESVLGGTVQNVLPTPRTKNDKGMFSIFMDEEIMQGANIEVTYKTSISNIGDVDNLWSYVQYETELEKINQWYEELTGTGIPNDADKQIEPIKITKLYSYYDNLIFRPEDNVKMQVSTGRVIPNGTDVQRHDNGELKLDNNTTISNTAAQWITAQNPKGNLSTLRRIGQGSVTEDKTQDLALGKGTEKVYSVLETTGLNGIELYPNKSGKTSTVSTSLKLSKTLATADLDAKNLLNFDNFVEIIATQSNTGRRDYEGKQGTFANAENFLKPTSTLTESDKRIKEQDTDAAQRIVILKPFGVENVIPYALIVGCVIIFAGGVIFIKRKVL